MADGWLLVPPAGGFGGWFQKGASGLRSNREWPHPLALMFKAILFFLAFGVVLCVGAAMAMSGSTHIYGSFAANSLEFKGGAQVHFDEAIRDGGLGASLFTVYDWDEL